ncbi:MAG: TolC family protein [Bacteroidia bacterium]
MMNKNLFILFLFLSQAGLSQVKKWSLKECMQTALEHNISLNQNKLTIESARAVWEQSQYNLYPTLNLSDAQNFNFGRSIDPVSYQYTSQNFATNTPSLNSTVTLYGGFRNLNLVKENKLSYMAGTLDLEKMQNDLSLNVIGAYMQVLLAAEAMNLAMEQAASTSIQAERTEKFVNAGKYPELNLLQVRSQLASDKSAIVDAENALQIAKVNLMQLMELPVVPEFDIEKPVLETALSELAITPAEVVYKNALSWQPQVKSAVYRSQAAETDLRISQGSILPVLSLSGALRTSYSSLRSRTSEQISYQRETIGYLQGNLSQPVIGLIPVSIISSSGYPIGKQFSDNFSQAAGLTLTIPIFNNFQGKYAIVRSKIGIQNARLNEDAVKIQLRKTVEQACTDQSGAAKKLAATTEQEKSEERTYVDMEKKLNAGIANMTDFLIEKSNYNKARISRLVSKYDYAYKTKVVDFYLGKPLSF